MLKKLPVCSLVILIFFSCEKRIIDSNTDALEISNKSSVTNEPEEIKINEDRWIDSADGMRMRSEPDSSSDTILVIPAYAKVLLIKETGDIITLQDHTGRWSNIEWDGKIGWIFGGFLTSEDLTPPPVTGPRNIIFYKDADNEVIAYDLDTGEEIKTGIVSSISGGAMWKGKVNPIYSLETNLVYIYDLKNKQTIIVYLEYSLEDDTDDEQGGGCHYFLFNLLV